MQEDHYCHSVSTVTKQERYLADLIFSVVAVWLELLLRLVVYMH